MRFRLSGLLVAAVMILSGCGFNVSRSVMSANATRDDGSQIHVEAITWQNPIKLSIGSKVVPNSQRRLVDVIIDDVTYTVSDSEIVSEDKQLAEVPNSAKHIRIEAYADGHRITVDGGELLLDTREQASE